MSICPGSNRVPPWESPTRSRDGDGYVCGECGQRVSASPNAAGVTRLDVHESRPAEISISIAGLAAVVGPDDVLVISVPSQEDGAEVGELAKVLRGRLGDRFLIIAGAEITVQQGDAQWPSA